MKPKRLLALGVLLVGVTAAASPTGAQKSAPPQPTELQKLKERVDALQSQLKEAQAKADRAAMEKDYIERIQKEVNAYYEKAFNTQVWTLTILGLVIGLVGKFGLDRVVQHKLSEASAELRTEFTRLLEKETQALREANTAQVKSLEENLTSRALHEFQFSQGMSQYAARKYNEARAHFRNALIVYKARKSQQPMDTEAGAKSLANIFQSFKEQDPAKFENNVKKELADSLYNDLEEELALSALDVPELAQVLKERREAPPSAPKS